MKLYPAIFLLLIVSLISCSSGPKLVRVQNAPPGKCKTQNPELNGSYTGMCRNGLAEGQGKAVGANKTYIGEFDNGLPDGKGKLITTTGGQQQTKQGYWYRGSYMGKEEVDPYHINEKRTVARVRVKQLNRTDNQVEIEVTPGNSNVTATTVQNIRLQGDSGSLKNNQQYRGYQNISFPFNGRVDFELNNLQDNGQNKRGYIEYNINAPGSWLIEITAM